MNIWQRGEWTDEEANVMFENFRDAWIAAGGYILDEYVRDIPVTWVESCFDEAVKNENYSSPEEAANAEWNKHQSEIEEYIIEDFRRQIEKQIEKNIEVELPKGYVYSRHLLSDILEVDDVEDVRTAVEGVYTKNIYWKWLADELFHDTNLKTVFEEYGENEHWNYSDIITDIRDCIAYPVKGIYTDDMCERLVTGEPTVDELKKLFTIKEMTEFIEGIIC